jgi:hypothetical protein
LHIDIEICDHLTYLFRRVILEELPVSVFITTHLAPSISDAELASYGPEVAACVHATFKQFYANSDSGHIFMIYEADSAEQVIEELERLGFPYEAIHEIDLQLDAAALAAFTA